MKIDDIDLVTVAGTVFYAVLGYVSILLLLASLLGCASPSVSDPAYPEYDKWWTETPGPRRSTNLSELGQGDILVFGNGQEAVLL